MKSEKTVLPFPMHVPGPTAALKLAGSQSSRTFTSWGFELAKALPVRASPAASVRAPAPPKRNSLRLFILLLHSSEVPRPGSVAGIRGRRPRRVKATLQSVEIHGQRTMRGVKPVPHDRYTGGRFIRTAVGRCGEASLRRGSRLLRQSGLSRREEGLAGRAAILDDVILAAGTVRPSGSDFSQVVGRSLAGAARLPVGRIHSDVARPERHAPGLQATRHDTAIGAANRLGAAPNAGGPVLPPLRPTSHVAPAALGRPNHRLERRSMTRPLATRTERDSRPPGG